MSALGRIEAAGGRSFNPDVLMIPLKAGTEAINRIAYKIASRSISERKVSEAQRYSLRDVVLDLSLAAGIFALAVIQRNSF